MHCQRINSIWSSQCSLRSDQQHHLEWRHFEAVWTNHTKVMLFLKCLTLESSKVTMDRSTPFRIIAVLHHPRPAPYSPLCSWSHNRCHWTESTDTDFSSNPSIPWTADCGHPRSVDSQSESQCDPTPSNARAMRIAMWIISRKNVPYWSHCNAPCSCALSLSCGHDHLWTNSSFSCIHRAP